MGSTVEAAPHDQRAFNNLGVAYQKADRPADARAAYRRALELEPRYAAAQENLIRANGTRL